MINKFTVDWEKTTTNIKNKLHGSVRIKTFSKALYLSEEAVYAKLRGGKLTIEELHIFATYLGCSIEDLLVFTDDKFVEQELEIIPARTDEEFPSAEEVSDTISLFSNVYEKYEIRNLQEFFLYLPLMEINNVKDVAFRLCDNLHVELRHYLFEKLNYLYKSIPETPAKKYADQYRNEVLRTKGAPRENFFPNEKNQFHYHQNVRLYASVISKETFDEKLKSFSDGQYTIEAL